MAANVRRESFGSGAILQFMSTAVTLVSGFIFYFILTRIFDTSTVGTISLLNTVTGLFAIIFALGLGYGLQHYISYYLGRDDYSTIRTLIRKFLATTFLIAILAYAFLWFAAPYISVEFFHDTSSTVLLKILGFNLSSFIMIGIFNSMMLGLQNFIKSATFTTYAGLSTYLFALVLAHFQSDPMMIVIGWSIGNVTAAAVMGISLLVESHKMKVPKGSDVRMKQVLTYSFPVFLAFLIQYGAAYVDRFALAFFTNLSDVGIYQIAMLVGTSLSFIIIPVNNILLPKFSEFFSRSGNREVRQSVRVSVNLLTFLYTPFALGIAALAPTVMLLMGGSSYLAGSHSLQIITIASAIFISQNVLVQSLSGTRHTNVLLFASGLPLISNIVLSIILIPPFAMVGAALSLASTDVVSFVVVYYFARKFDLFNFDFRTVPKIWAAALIMFAVVYLAQYEFGFGVLNVVAYVLIGLFSFLLSSKALKIIKQEEVDFIFSRVPKSLVFAKKILMKFV